MSEILHSPVTLAICLVTVLAWIAMLTVIFWPRRRGERNRDRRDMDKRNGYF